MSLPPALAFGVQTGARGRASRCTWWSLCEEKAEAALCGLKGQEPQSEERIKHVGLLHTTPALCGLADGGLS